MGGSGGGVPVGVLVDLIEVVWFDRAFRVVVLVKKKRKERESVLFIQDPVICPGS